MKQLLVTAILLIVLAIPTAIHAYEYNVQLTDRTQIRGTYLGSKDGNMLFETEKFPLVLIPLSSIRSLYKGRSDVTPLLLANQLPFDTPVQDMTFITPESLSVPSSEVQQSMTLNSINNSIRASSVPLWLLAISSVASTIYLFTK